MHDEHCACCMRHKRRHKIPTVDEVPCGGKIKSLHFKRKKLKPSLQKKKIGSWHKF